MNDEYLAEITSELHNLNINIMELTKVLREKQSSSNGETTDDVLDEIKHLHDDHNKLSEVVVKETLETEKKFREQQAGFDRQLKHLGIM